MMTATFVSRDEIFAMVKETPFAMVKETPGNRMNCSYLAAGFRATGTHEFP
jgi:hypothetical protein